MGPVSFEPIDAGESRDDAMALARRLAAIGVRVMSLGSSEVDGGERWHIVIRSADVAEARRLLDKA